MKIVTIIGARPQFIKAAAISNAILTHNQNNPLEAINEVIIHTGQHFDPNMSTVFFDEMKIPKPDYLLNINSLGHGAMTGRMLEEVEKILINEEPDYVLVYGDTNSTLAGALAASKLHIKVAHVEAGLRSFNMKMPEEINRILTDRISTLLFCPSETAVKNLQKEGFDNFKSKVLNVGDVMYDTTLHFSKMAKEPTFELPENFILATVHRAENTDDINNLKEIFSAFNTIVTEIPVVLPIHPRTKNILEKNNVEISDRVQLVPPVGYLEMLYLLNHCQLVMTDSGGLQKEAYFSKKYCITLREETEWVELVDNGVNQLVGASESKIIKAFNEAKQLKPNFENHFYGDGKASSLIISHIIKYL
ncbi:non-hydrolyzing UDP-N-acetylglucosamine 2-epimerase [Planktosalinus lacus]|uniref:UDP-2,3-diacetamido-2,3-dideoxy-D-glucuronate 2-epimerase n=1 Tax=Planktosalinus lacus TaxID=1526573 RepID=A0A8J2VEN2_9FLAO|nr:UDP-N-acetylglucosamine 2-epimerase (non-hydrolyzing) [Planktosalinus lacus]GGE00639.1 UDP-2,3-diacetamido-2,3-dideoxy-D-glucuronate 2-epimerase [Planktosalinus lacus]